jgi:hypothetical protein
MRGAVLSLVLATGITLCYGCERSSAPTAPSPSPGTPPPASTALRGISVEVRGEGSVTTNQNIGEGALTVAGKNRLQIQGGRAIVNGKDGGQLKSGDSVLLDKDGRLFVNSQERTLK